jgi:3-methyladenine DNA glycosylase AlkD
MPRKSLDGALLLGVRHALANAADASRAAAMKAYMKSVMPYHGVPMPRVRAICKQAFAPLSFPTRATWEREVRALWTGARFREERYAAVALTAVRAARPYQTPEAIPLYEMMITSGAWWDLVDELATNRVGAILHTHQQPTRPLMRRWSKDADMWKRRTSIICQTRARAETDLDLLYACIEPSIASREFFLRKAIGWALREYAHVDPQEVARYVRRNESRLSGLSKREALKHAGRVTSRKARRRKTTG